MRSGCRGWKQQFLWVRGESDDRKGAADHAHGTAEGNAAGALRREFEEVVSGCQHLLNAERGDHEAARAASCLCAVDVKTHGNARADYDVTRLVAGTRDDHRDLLHAVLHWCGGGRDRRVLRAECGGECAGNIDTDEGETAVQIVEREHKDQRSCETKEQA